jgi:hypothetical protein
MSPTKFRLEKYAIEWHDDIFKIVKARDCEKSVLVPKQASASSKIERKFFTFSLNNDWPIIVRNCRTELIGGHIAFLDSNLCGH